MSAPRVALVTCEAFSALAEDDRPLLPALAAAGVRAEPRVWTDPKVRWSELDAVVLRSVWDYHLRIAKFRAFLDRLEDLRVPVFNPLALVRWNLDKGYLDELAARGAPTLETRRIPQGDRRTLAEAAAGWGDAVVKPAISASAFSTFRTGALEPGEAERRFRALVAERDALIQEFCPEVLTEGEWSLVFFGGVFSHAVLKRPAPGDFRVQHEWGGSVLRVDPPKAVQAAAGALLRHLPVEALYARVDGFVRDGAFRLVELELIEPSLHFAGDAAAVARFAGRVAAAVGGRL